MPQTLTPVPIPEWKVTLGEDLRGWAAQRDAENRTGIAQQQANTQQQSVANETAQVPGMNAARKAQVANQYMDQFRLAIAQSGGDPKVVEWATQQASGIPEIRDTFGTFQFRDGRIIQQGVDGRQYLHMVDPQGNVRPIGATEEDFMRSRDAQLAREATLEAARTPRPPTPGSLDSALAGVSPEENIATRTALAAKKTSTSLANDPTYQTMKRQSENTGKELAVALKAQSDAANLGDEPVMQAAAERVASLRQTLAAQDAELLRYGQPEQAAPSLKPMAGWLDKATGRKEREKLQGHLGEIQARAAELAQQYSADELTKALNLLKPRNERRRSMGKAEWNELDLEQAALTMALGGEGGSSGGKQVVRRGRSNGRNVVQYSDGTVVYEDDGSPVE